MTKAGVTYILFLATDMPYTHKIKSTKELQFTTSLLEWT